MNNNELKYIKKLYGENFMHLCRSLFPTILETEGLLTKIISTKFAPTHSLYQDIKNNNLENEFKNYIYSLVDVEKEKPEERVIESPEELMKKAGYILYPECKTEEEIQSFKHYYSKGEELCTFRGRRLNTCRVWFAVKENVKEIKRQDFKNPSRQDEYGTSVISIQFSKGNNSTLSIKNRYNHTVNNPDATFSNNLNNIIEGLEESFCKTYNINLVNGNENSFEIPNYVMANDGKFYRKNLEIFGVNYCENNIIIKDNGEVCELDKFTQILFENYVLDLKNKKIVSLVDDESTDSFTKSIGEIKDIKIQKDGDGKDVIITPTKGNNVIIKINNHNEIIGYTNENVKFVENEFLYYNEQLTEINLPNVEIIVNVFLFRNEQLTEINLQNVKEIGNYFLCHNENLTNIDLPKVEKIGNCFLVNNKNLTSINLPNVKELGDRFLYLNEELININLPEVKTIGNNFLYYNNELTKINLPNVKELGNYFLYYNENLTNIDLPNVKEIRNWFLYCNKNLTSITLPKVEKIGNDFLHFNKNIKFANIPLKLLEKMSFSKLKMFAKAFKNYNKYIKHNNEENIK